MVSSWGLSENNRRARFYRIAELGRKKLAEERENWRRITDAVGLVLGMVQTHS
jgi:PadR family transcriptional regulator PadR